MWATPEQLAALQRSGEAVGLPHVVDSGQGVTLTRFDHPPGDIGPALRKGDLTADINSATGAEPQRVTVDHDLIDYVPEWR